MAQERVTKPAPRRTKETVVAEKSDAADAKQELKDRMDELLDEVDEVLEENAETFVKQFVQKGGEATRVFLDWLLRPGVRLRF